MKQCKWTEHTEDDVFVTDCNATFPSDVDMLNDVLYCPNCGKTVKYEDTETTPKIEGYNLEVSLMVTNMNEQLSKGKIVKGIKIFAPVNSEEIYTLSSFGELIELDAGLHNIQIQIKSTEVLE